MEHSRGRTPPEAADARRTREFGVALEHTIKRHGSTALARSAASSSAAIVSLLRRRQSAAPAVAEGWTLLYTFIAESPINGYGTVDSRSTSCVERIVAAHELRAVGDGEIDVAATWRVDDRAAHEVVPQR